MCACKVDESVYMFWVHEFEYLVGTVCLWLCSFVCLFKFECLCV